MSTASGAARVVTDEWSTWASGSMPQSTHIPEPWGAAGSSRRSVTAS
ncbi:hypothetical protein [Actinoalloteichus caeruleus]|nr:hypothetical protein [Actinoalloteichus caeruleus]